MKYIVLRWLDSPVSYSQAELKVKVLQGKQRVSFLHPVSGFHESGINFFKVFLRPSARCQFFHQILQVGGNEDKQTIHWNKVSKLKIHTV